MNQMKRILFIVLIFLMVISLLSGCGKKSQVPVEPEYKLPSGCWKFEGDPPVLDVIYTDDPSDQNNKCIKITGTTGENNFGLVGQLIDENIPIGKKLKLTFRIKMINLTGEGAAIAIRCDDDTLENEVDEQFYTTEGKVSITGTQDWQFYSIEMEDVVQPNITSIRLFALFLPNTSGTVYFDFISLEEVI